MTGMGALSGKGTSLVQVWGRDGNDVVEDHQDIAGQITAFWGGPGADEGKGMARAYGGGGNDILAASGSPIKGAPHDDEVLIPTELRGGPGADIVRGAQADDGLWGGSGPDRLTAHYGNDVANGGTGSDIIKVDDGRRDDVDCGPGVDRVHPDSRDSIVRCETTV